MDALLVETGVGQVLVDPGLEGSLYELRHYGVQIQKGRVTDGSILLNLQELVHVLNGTTSPAPLAEFVSSDAAIVESPNSGGVDYTAMTDEERARAIRDRIKEALMEGNVRLRDIARWNTGLSLGGLSRHLTRAKLEFARASRDE